MVVAAEDFREGEMPFRIELAPVVDAKLKQALKARSLDQAATMFWNDLKRLMKAVASTGDELGEPLYEYKHVPFQCRAALRGHFGVRFAISAEHQVVLIPRLTLSENNAYGSSHKICNMLGLTRC